MADNTIGPLQGMRNFDGLRKAKDKNQLQGLSNSFNFKPISMPSGTEQTPKGDSINLSDEIREKSPQGPQADISALKDIFSNIKNQLNVNPSGNNSSEGLVQNALDVQGEGKTPQGPKLGPNPGIFNGGVYSSKNGSQNLKGGAKAGNVFSSMRTSPEAYQPGGGTATPKMVKLQTNYAQALKNGDTISEAANNNVLQTFANSGKDEKPIKSMIGI